MCGNVGGLVYTRGSWVAFAQKQEGITERQIESRQAWLNMQSWTPFLCSLTAAACSLVLQLIGRPQLSAEHDCKV
jgi:hypothetical protein